MRACMVAVLAGLAGLAGVVGLVLGVGFWIRKQHPGTEQVIA